MSLTQHDTPILKLERKKFGWPIHHMRRKKIVCRMNDLRLNWYYIIDLPWRIIWALMVSQLQIPIMYMNTIWNAPDCHTNENDTKRLKVDQLIGVRNMMRFLFSLCLAGCNVIMKIFFLCLSIKDWDAWAKDSQSMSRSLGSIPFYALSHSVT